jgi:acetylornithine deacetylase/succinyl-diaminopimelate desuccinylase-like protein
MIVTVFRSRVKLEALQEYMQWLGTEGSQFQGAGIPTVVCGPGSIEQAHNPNEFVAIDQVLKCEQFMRRLMERVCAH